MLLYNKHFEIAFFMVQRSSSLSVCVLFWILTWKNPNAAAADDDDDYEQRQLLFRSIVWNRLVVARLTRLPLCVCVCLFQDMVVGFLSVGRM